ncbi:MAG: hypothetical protein Q4G09_00545 [Clostridia bacterium]|nr:hypothetical protein [Clostridia bacterium]
MSKLYDTYISLKTNEKDNENTLYLFKSGIFFICIDKDAKKASQILNLKLTNLNQDIVKCGFPIKSLEKYSTLLNISNYSFKIIDSNLQTTFKVNNYSIPDNIDKLLLKISNIDTNNLSVSKAYSFIDNIKDISKSILNTK